MCLKIASSCSLLAANVSTVFGVSRNLQLLFGRWHGALWETNSVKTALNDEAMNFHFVMGLRYRTFGVTYLDGNRGVCVITFLQVFTDTSEAASNITIQVTTQTLETASNKTILVTTETSKAKQNLSGSCRDFRGQTKSFR
jgi:hypothetical protein